MDGVDGWCGSSTKGASRQRRSLINSEIVALRQLLPVSDCARQRLSQLQTMSLACICIRKYQLLGAREFIDSRFSVISTHCGRSAAIKTAMKTRLLSRMRQSVSFQDERTKQDFNAVLDCMIVPYKERTGAAQITQHINCDYTVRPKIILSFVRPWLHVKLEKVAHDGSVECCAPPPR